MARKRVLHVGLDFHLGGIETYLLKITTHVDKSRFEFCFLMYDNVKPYYYDELTVLGCKFYSITSRRKNWFKNHNELKQLFIKEKFDIVQCHLNSLSYIAPVIEAVHATCKVIVLSRNSSNMSNWKSRVLHNLNYYRLPKHKVIRAAVSDLAGKWMFGNKVSFIVLNNGLDTEKYSYSEKSRNEIRQEFDICDKELVFHHGAFRAQKNHKFLIDIFNEYQKKHTNSMLMLVGDGHLKPEIEEYVTRYDISEKVIFTGVRSDIPKLLSAADKYLFPSFYEGFPNALIEAETAGLYCVAADTITNQVRVVDQCVYVSLEAPISKWVEKLSHPPLENRYSSVSKIETLGLGIRQEMERLYAIYED